MNKIDPDEEEDEDGNPVPSTRPVASYKSRAPEAQKLAQQYNNNTQQMTNTIEAAAADGVGRSNHQPHQQAWLKYQQEQQRLQAQQPPVREPRESRSDRSRSSHHNRDHKDREHRELREHRHKSNHSSSKSNANNYSGEMVLDPETGEMIPAPHDDDDDEEDDVAVLNQARPVTIKLGQLTSKHGNSTQVCCGINSFAVSCDVFFLFFFVIAPPN